AARATPGRVIEHSSEADTNGGQYAGSASFIDSTYRGAAPRASWIIASTSASPSGSSFVTVSKSGGQSRVSEGSTVVATRCVSVKRRRRAMSSGSSVGRYHVVYV